MTHAAKYRQNKRLLQGYDAYLNECGDYGDRMKLCTEIARLHAQNQRIEQMSYQATKNDIDDYTIRVNSHFNLPARQAGSHQFVS